MQAAFDKAQSFEIANDNILLSIYSFQLQRYRLKMLQRALLKNLRQRLLWLSASFLAIKSIQERIAQLVIMSATDVEKGALCESLPFKQVPGKQLYSKGYMHFLDEANSTR